MEMQPNILSTISAGARRRENMRLLALKNRLNAVKEEMLLSRDVQDQYNKIPYGDERDQLEFDFTCINTRAFRVKSKSRIPISKTR